MKKILLVLKNEITTIISRPSFWLALVGLPLVGALIFAGIGAINKSASATQTVSQVFSGPQDTRPEGYADLSGIIRQIPESVPPATFVAYPNETSARQALAAGEISAFYIVPADYIQKGEITYIRPDFNPLASSGDQSNLFTWVVQVNLAGGDILFTNLVNGPLKVDETSLAVIASPDENNPLALWTPYIITIIFYMLIVGSASLLLSNISKEKENRVIEMLLTSVTPRQLLTGKILGLGIVGLGQTVFWFGTSYILLNLSGRTFQLPSAIHLPISFLAWGLVFFILGYAVYASLMAGLGALAPNLREASQATFVITMPLMVPLFLSSSVFMQAPNGTIAIVLSLFPLSAPVAMMARLSAGGVAWWQPLLAAVLLAATAVLIVRAVAGMFRAQALLSGQGFKLKTYLRAL
ncbi:MAG: ABC transporter permease, partial [Chloroflexi bacterium]|nr:ABC transporter permease [Chloroflexota bacterium]